MFVFKLLYFNTAILDMETVSCGEASVKIKDSHDCNGVCLLQSYVHLGPHIREDIIKIDYRWSFRWGACGV